MSCARRPAPYRERCPPCGAQPSAGRHPREQRRQRRALGGRQEERGPSGVERIVHSSLLPCRVFVNYYCHQSVSHILIRPRPILACPFLHTPRFHECTNARDVEAPRILFEPFISVSIQASSVDQPSCTCTFVLFPPSLFLSLFSTPPAVFPVEFMSALFRCRCFLSSFC